MKVTLSLGMTVPDTATIEKIKAQCQPEFDEAAMDALVEGLAAKCKETGQMQEGSIPAENCELIVTVKP